MSKHFSKRVAMFLAVIMIICMFPAATFAADPTPPGIVGYVMKDAGGNLIQFMKAQLDQSMAAWVFNSDLPAASLYKYFRSLMADDENPVAYLYAQLDAQQRIIENTATYMQRSVVTAAITAALTSGSSAPGGEPVDFGKAIEEAITESAANEPPSTVVNGASIYEPPALDEDGTPAEDVTNNQPVVVVDEDGSPTVTDPGEEPQVPGNELAEAKTAMKAEIDALISGLNEALYTTDSWSTVTAAIEDAKAAIDLLETVEEVEAYDYSAVETAIDNLVIAASEDAVMAALDAAGEAIDAFDISEIADDADALAEMKSTLEGLYSDLDTAFETLKDSEGYEADAELEAEVSAALAGLTAAIDDIDEAIALLEGGGEPEGIEIASIRIASNMTVLVETTDPGDVTLTKGDFTVTYDGTAVSAFTFTKNSATEYIITISPMTAGKDVTVTGKNNLTGTDTVTYYATAFSGTVTANDKTTTTGGTGTPTEAAAAGTIVTIKRASDLEPVYELTVGVDGKYYYNLPAGAYNVYFAKEGYAEIVAYGQSPTQLNRVLASNSTEIKGNIPTVAVEGSVISVVSGITGTDLDAALELAIGTTAAGNIVVQTSETDATPVTSAAVVGTNAVKVTSESGDEDQIYTIELVDAAGMLELQLNALTLGNGGSIDQVSIIGWQVGMQYKINDGAFSTSATNIVVSTTDTITVSLISGDAEPKVFSAEDVAAAMTRAPEPGVTINFTTEKTSVIPNNVEYNTIGEDAETWTLGRGIAETITPGTTYYFRKKMASPNKTTGVVQTLVAPARPAAPTGITLTKDVTTAGQVVLSGSTSAMEYRLGGAAYGAAGLNQAVVAGPGDIIYVRMAATATDFASEALALTVSSNDVSKTILGNNTYTVSGTAVNTGENIHYNSATGVISVGVGGASITTYTSDDLENFDKFAAVIGALIEGDQFTVNSGEITAVTFAASYASLSSDKTVNLGTNIKADATIAFDSTMAGTNDKTLTVKGNTSGGVAIKGDIGAAVKIDVSDANLTGDVTVTNDTEAHPITLAAGAKTVLVNRDACVYPVNLLSAGALTLQKGQVIIPEGKTVTLTRDSSVTDNASNVLDVRGILNVNAKLNMVGGNGGATTTLKIGESSTPGMIVIGPTGYLNSPQTLTSSINGNKITVIAGGRYDYYYTKGAEQRIGVVGTNTKDARILLKDGTFSIGVEGGKGKYELDGSADITTDFQIKGSESAVVKNGTLTVPSGYTLTIGGVFTVEETGTLDIKDGTLDLDEATSELNVEGTLKMTGAAYEAVRGASETGSEIVFIGSSAKGIIDGTTVYGTGGMIELNDANSKFIIADNGSGRGYTVDAGTVTIAGTLGKCFTIASNDTLTVSQPATLVVAGDQTKALRIGSSTNNIAGTLMVTNTANAGLYVTYSGTLTIAGTGALVLNEQGMVGETYNGNNGTVALAVGAKVTQGKSGVFYDQTVLVTKTTQIIVATGTASASGLDDGNYDWDGANNYFKQA